ncbi:MAG TPA: flavodoxin domain-containing protein [Bryobacteraceae bacterium]|nr:flavodoxin domain-containing protein [Bryobacteraceae bacterium]
MKPIAVFYATREGHTQQIAEHIAATLKARGLEADVRNLRNPSSDVLPTNYAGIVLAASVHCGKHEPEIARFVKQHRAELETIPAAFLSVTMSEAGAERTDATPREHAQFAADVQRVMDQFFADTGWHPKYVKPVAGALLYTRYNVLIRFIMKHIAKASGGDTDTSRDYDYTDWAALDRFVEDFVSRVSIPVAG